jgi:hypothetical protein
MSLLKLSDRVRRISDEDGAVLLNLNDGKYYGLNRIGDRICDALSTGMTRDQIIAFVRDDCEDVPKAVDGEVNSFIEQLRKSSLLSETHE